VRLVYLFTFFSNNISENSLKYSMNAPFCQNRKRFFSFQSSILPFGTTRFPVNKPRKEKQFSSVSSRDLCGPLAIGVLTRVRQPQLHQVKDKMTVREKNIWEILCVFLPYLSI
jgi:hypothetical protein